MSFKYLTHSANYGATQTVAASGSSAVYPIANIQNPRLSKVWRSNNDLSDVDITADLGVARAVSIIGLVNHNLTSLATLAVAAGTTSGVSDFSATITYREGAAYAMLPSSQSYRYWRIRLNDSSNTDGYLEAGYLLLGLAETTPRGIAYDPGITVDHISDVNAQVTEFGAIFADPINDRKRITVSFGAMTRAQRDTLLTFVTGLREETTPLFVIPEESQYAGWYVRLITTAAERTNLYSTVGPLTFMEEGSGKRMPA